MKRKIGLALSGGGARGFAHIGVLKALVRAGIPIDLLAGTSAGSIAGAAIAAGLSPEELEDIALQVRYSSVALPTVSRYGLLSNERLGDLVRKHFGTSDFASLEIPLGVTAYDVLSNKGIVIETGDVAEAVRASSAVPRIFTPVRFDGMFLIDGGMYSPLPAAAARNIGADIVIGVDLTACGARFKNTPKSSAGILIRSSMAILATASTGQHKDADVVISPKIAEFSMFAIGPAKQMIERGELAARSAIPQIMKILEKA